MPGEKKIIIEKPHILHRIFFNIRVVLGVDTWYPSKISFDDPQFSSYCLLCGTERYFEAAGIDIFQGNIWVVNEAGIGLWYASTEILH